MYSKRSGLAVALTSLVFAVVGGWGVGDLCPELEPGVRGWLAHTFDLLILLAHTAIQRWIEGLLEGREREQADRLPSSTET